MRKQNLLLLFSLIIIIRVSAQFDERFYFPQKEWVPISGVNYQEITIKAGDDKLNGILIKPVSEPKATILYCHGAGGNVSTSVDLVKPLVADGYQVFMIDFRGFGKSTGKPTHLNVLADGQLVLDYLLERKDVKKIPLIVYGASMGTQIATHLAKDNPTKIKGLVLDGPLSSFTDIAMVHLPDFKDLIRQMVTSPYSAQEDIKEVKIPKLVIATKTDEMVPFEQSELVYANAPEPKELYVFEGAHIRSMLSHPNEAVAAVNRLLVK